jgi:hypothetical protein
MDEQRLTRLSCLVPYGNTRYAGGSYTCQHGADECRSDLLGLCLLALLGGGDTAITSGSSSRQAFPYFLCLEKRGGASKAAPDCFGDTLARSPVAWADVVECADNETRANELQALGAAETPAAHEYVPWTLVDGELFEDPNPKPFLGFVCAQYTGPLPDACWDSPKSEKAVDNAAHRDNECPAKD